MKLKEISIKDKEIFTEFLNLERHELAVYSFENIYIWKKLFIIEWALIENELCIFFRDKLGCFLYLPPQGPDREPEAIRKAFDIMDSFNKNHEISRIENLEESGVVFYRGLGYQCLPKPGDYLCRRIDLAQLKGNRFKAKRACFNYFVKNYAYEYAPLSRGDTIACFKLYKAWMGMRKTKSSDALYRGMLEDSLNCLKVLLQGYGKLDLTGRVVKVQNKIKAFSIGYPLNKDTFCILYEITDLTLKGLSQFIFRRFCQELKTYKYINIMDDSGLENLKRVKLSYQPLKIIPSYIVKRKNG